MKIKLLKFNDDLIWPTRAHHNDVGMDVYALERHELQTGQQKAIPLGFGLEIPTGYAGFVYPKSGLASMGIVAELSPIDPGYRGEIHAIVSYHGPGTIELLPGRKIGQLVILPIVYPELIEELGEEREDGGFGSTGS